MDHSCPKSGNSMKILQVASPLHSYTKNSTLIDKKISETLKSGDYILGKNVKLFEKNFSNFQKQKFCIGVANGTDALEISLDCLGINKKKDLVIVPSHTATATVSAVVNSGATPIFCEIDEETNNLSIDAVKRILKYKNIKAIIFVHLYGNSEGIKDVVKIAKEEKIAVIEDCSQAHGAEINGCRVGNFGDIACFSCYPTKNLGAIGDAGIISTNNISLYKKALRLREYGWGPSRISLLKGRNSRLDELQAGILNVKLKHLDSDNKKRIAIAKYYNKKLMSLPIYLPRINLKENVFHLYVIKVRPKLRNKLLKYLRNNNINAGIHYRVPNHLHPAFQAYKAIGSLEITEKAASQIISIPNYPELKKSEIDYIINKISSFFKQ